MTCDRILAIEAIFIYATVKRIFSLSDRVGERWFRQAALIQSKPQPVCVCVSVCVDVKKSSARQSRQVQHCLDCTIVSQLACIESYTLVSRGEGDSSTAVHGTTVCE